MDSSDLAYQDARRTFDETFQDLRDRSRDVLKGCYALRGYQAANAEELLDTAKHFNRLLNQRTKASPTPASAEATLAQANSACGKNVCDSLPKPNHTPPASAPTTVASRKPVSVRNTHFFPSKWNQLVPTVLSDILSPLLLFGAATLVGLAVADIRQRGHFSQTSASPDGAALEKTEEVDVDSS